MSEIITTITSKPDWENKINDAAIVNKWEEELQQQGVSNVILERVIELLKKSTASNEYEGEDEYEWHLELGADCDDIWTGCKSCECMICAGEEHLARSLEDYEEDDEDYRETQKQLKKFAKIKCKCQNKWVDDNLNFLRTYIHHKMKVVKSDLKKRFIAHVNDFESRKAEKDYHPGSNDQMLDIIHPAMYCYVKRVTPVTNGGEELVERSSLFQWIPSEFSVIRDPSTNEPTRTEIRSYINNLDRNDPRNADLYQDISEIFTDMVPGFEKVLNTLKEKDRINALKDTEKPAEIKLGDCQVIVKIASAQVNQDKPVFDEGSWHLEGVESEKIIATGIYYYDMKNVEKTNLRFRTTLGGDIYNLNYPQNCHEFVRLHYGLNLKYIDGMDGADTAIKLGRIPTKENLCLFFPNFLQHRVSKLELSPGATEGHRSILVFFLVNPFEKVISTAHIPTPQQQLISTGDAKLYRELLMFERKYEYSEQNNFHQRGISLCEH
mmetsp:Transcript_3299/g.3613  ORF Transcript_3299/g.3613 Transcript_3299/m.3613 type:complete len:494 (+) Transcript_3299:73-1554(+)